MTTKEELKQLATQALVVSNGFAVWLAIDLNGMVCAFRQKPSVRNTVWDVHLDINYECWRVAEVVPPVDFRHELYKINKLLSNE